MPAAYSESLPYLPELQHVGATSVAEIGALALQQEQLHHAVSPEQQSIAKDQEAMIGTYFMRATQELPAASSETAVWDKIFDLQAQELVSATTETEKDRIALSMLVGNQLSQYGIFNTDAEKLRVNRAWKMAQTGEGARINKAAEENIGLCVVTGQPTRPYQSVSEQLAPLVAGAPSSGFSELLKVTDKNFQGRTAVHEVIMGSANEEQATWLINKAVEVGDMLSVGYNVVDVQPTFREPLIRKLLADGNKIHQTLLRPEPPFSEALPREEVVADALRYNPEALTTQNFTDQPPEQRAEMITEVLSKVSVDSAESWLKYHLTDVDANLLPLFADKLGAELNNTALEKFNSFPANALRTLTDQGVNLYCLGDSLGKFDMADQAVILKEAELGEFTWRDAIYSTPEAFKLLSKDELLEHARKHDSLWYIANNIDVYTDGSDQGLMLELINLDRNFANQITSKITALPNLDKQWLVDTFRQQDMEELLSRSLRELAGYVDPKQFLLDRLEAEDFSSVGYIVQQIAKGSQPGWGAEATAGVPADYGVEPAELYELLEQHGAYNAILQNVSWGGPFEAIKEKVIDQLMVLPGGPEALVKNIHALGKDANVVPLYEHAVELKLDSILAYNYEQFVEGGVALEAIVPQLMTSSAGVGVLIRDFSEKPAIQQLCNFEALIETAYSNGYTTALFSNLKVLPADMHDKLVDLAFAHDDTFGLNAAIDQLAVDRRAVARRLLAEGQSWAVYTNPLGYYGKGFGGLGANDLLSDGAASVVIRWRDRFEDYDEAAVVRSFIEQGQTRDFIKNCGRLAQPLDNEARLYLAREGGALLAQKYPDIYGPITADIVAAALEGDDPNFLRVYELSTEKLPWLDVGIKLLGPDTAARILAASQYVAEGSSLEIPADLQALGVKSRGQQGYEELRALPGLMRQKLLEQGDNPAALPGLIALMTDNAYAASAARQTVRFNEAEWGNKGNAEWAKLITGHMARRAEHATLPAGFEVSAPITISQIDAKEFDPSKIDQDAQDRYGVLHADVVQALTISRRSGADKYADILAQGSALLEQDLVRLETVRAGLVEQGNDKALVNIDGQLGAIRTILEADPKAFKELLQNSFETVGNLKVKGLDSVVRTIALARAFTKSSNASDLAQKVAVAELSHDALGSMDTLISYLVNDEVYRDYFKTDQSRKSFTKLSDTTSLRAQLTKLQQGAATGKSTIQFVPSRGLLMEMSGHIADACWASKYDSIAEAFPNISSLTFVRDRGTKNERLVGSCLLIDTIDENTKEPVLIVRGINPIENYINKVKVDEFAGALFEYVRSIAGDRKVAAVFDAKPGRAATNRPILHQYLMKDFAAGHKQGEALQLPADTTFNGYELTIANGEPAFEIA
ncbi:MAG: hypothetical protein QFB87_02920 [Patescibacteria group bacterium]|nr:hypothetical protein [Patescibacteria group bacterium]